MQFVSCVPYTVPGGQSPPGCNTLIRPQALSGQVYRHLLRMILAGDLAPDSSLQEVELAAQLGVSRTPARGPSEAGRKRLHRGPAQSQRPGAPSGAGTGPLPSNPRALEGPAAELACGRLTAADLAPLEARPRRARRVGPGLLRRAKVDRIRRDAAPAGGGAVPQSGPGGGDRQAARAVPAGDGAGRAGARRSGRLTPAEREWLLREEWRQHAAVVAALKSGDPAESRTAMVEHLLSISASRAGRVPSRSEAARGRRPAVGRCSIRVKLEHHT